MPRKSSKIKGVKPLRYAQSKSRVLNKKIKARKAQSFWLALIRDLIHGKYNRTSILKGFNFDTSTWFDKLTTRWFDIIHHKSFSTSFIKSLKKVMTSLAIFMLVVGMNFTGLWAVGTTVAYFNDIETASNNELTAGYLDFSLSEYTFESSIGLDETISKNTVLVNGGGMDFQYTLEAEEIADVDGFCGALNLQAKLNGVAQYDGNLMSLATPASTVLGTWQFNIELPVDETSFINGEECQFDVVFKGWQTNVASYDDGGFNDEERMTFTITAGKMVVLNEFLPNPDGFAYGFDFGNDSDDMPQGEWVELYNNSTGAIDLAGWYLRDATEGEGNKTNITALNTAPATTTIAGKSWLVVYMNKAIYNNTGDTVRLFDDSNTLVDSHTYDVSDFCEIEPSPGASNSEDAFEGDCPNVPPNKSYARIPDGIGDWVDPIPTPGGVNILENEAGEYIYSESSISFEEIMVEQEEVLINEETTTPGEENAIAEEEVITEGEEATVTEEETIVEEEATNDAEEITVEEETVVEEETIIEENVVDGSPADEEDVITGENIIIEEDIAVEEEPPQIEEATAGQAAPESELESTGNENNETI